MTTTASPGRGSLSAPPYQLSTEQVLAEEERRRLVEILENTTDFVGIADFYGNLQYLNRAGRALVGVGQDEVEIAEAADTGAEEKRLVADYNETFANPYIAASLGYLDDVIMPEKTRPMIIHALEGLLNKRQQLPPKKHGNIPL